MTASHTQQMQAIEAAARYLRGGPKPRPAEVEMITAHLADAQKAIAARAQIGVDPWRNRR